MVELLPGDALVWFNLPPAASHLITWVSEGNAAHHCGWLHWDHYSRHQLPAGCLSKQLYLYEAVPPHTHRIALVDYIPKLVKRSKNWKYKLVPWKKKLYVEVWRWPEITEHHLEALHQKLVKMLDIPYRVGEYWFPTVRNCNCSEMATRAGLIAGILNRKSLPSRIQEKGRVDQITPWEFRELCRHCGADRVAKTEPAAFM